MGNEFDNASQPPKTDGHEVDEIAGPSAQSSEWDDPGVEVEKRDSDSSEDGDEGERQYHEVEGRPKVMADNFITPNADFVYSAMEKERCNT